MQSPESPQAQGLLLPSFARFLLDAARGHGFKGLVATLGANALALAREYKPHVLVQTKMSWSRKSR